MKNFSGDTKAISEHSLKKQYIHIVDETNIVSKTNPKGIITYVNKKFVEISGYSKEELIGKPHNIVRDPENTKEFFKELWSTIQSKNVWSGIITNIHKNGSKYTVEASIFPIIDDYGDIVEYIAIRHDITKLQELNKEVKKLHDYDIAQQKMARDKLEAEIINELDINKHKILYKPSDILSGDSYSAFKRQNGSVVMYIIDGQGHGISPAMTVFAVSSLINQMIHHVKSMDELVQQLFPAIQTFLGEIEQLSFTIVKIGADRKTLTYTSGGMYPFYIKDAKGNITKHKANNTPFMNFSQTPVVNEIKLESFDSLIIYSDGIVEHEHKEIKFMTPVYMLENPDLIDESLDTLSHYKFDDDVTLIYYKDKE